VLLSHLLLGFELDQEMVSVLLASVWSFPISHLMVIKFTNLLLGAMILIRCLALWFLK